MNPYKIAIYARVSTKEQSCELQVADLKDWALRHEFPVFGVYQDQGVSGRTSERPAFEKLMEDARQGYFKAVVVYKLCRFGRSLADVTRHILELDALGIRFVATTQSIDTNDKSPMGRMLISLFAALAQFESDLMAERIQDGIAYARANGTKSGKSIGRQRVKVDRGRVLELRSGGMSYREIARAVGVSTTTVVRKCFEKGEGC